MRLAGRRRIGGLVLVAALVTSACGSSGNEATSTRTTPDPTPTVATSPVPWAEQVDGVWQVDVDAFECPETADELYATVASGSFPFVTERDGTAEHAWPAGEIEDAVQCLHETPWAGDEVVRSPGPGRFPSYVDQFEAGDWPLPEPSGSSFGIETGTGASILVLDYAAGDDVVVYSWWGSKNPPGSLAEARDADGFTTGAPFRSYRNGRVGCVVEYDFIVHDRTERTCTPHS